MKSTEKNIYFIPVNFSPEGYIFGIKARNLAEAVLFVSFFGGLTYLFAPLTGGARVCAVLVAVLIPGGIGIIGINGLSITEFLTAFFSFQMSKRLLKKPTSKDRITREKKLLAKQKKQRAADLKKMQKDAKARKKLEAQEARREMKEMKKRKKAGEEDEDE